MAQGVPKGAAFPARAFAFFRREPSWISIGAGQTTALVWLALMAAHYLFPAASARPLIFAASGYGAAIVGVFGFVVPVIFGMFPRVSPGLVGVPRPPHRLAMAAAVLGALTSFSALGWLLTGEPELIPAAAFFTLGGGVVLVLTVAGARRGEGKVLRVAATRPFERLALPGNLLLGCGLLYLLIGSAALGISMEPALGQATGIRHFLAAPLHLLTAGFIVLTVFGVGLRMFSAFAGAEPPVWLAWLLAVLAIPAPIGITIGLEFSGPLVLAVFGSIGIGAACTFAATVVYLATHLKARRRRPAWWLLLAASACLIGGETLGVLFALDPLLRVTLAAVHAQVNVLGFAGLMIFGVLFEFSGGRAARPDVITPGTWIAFVWPAGFVLLFLGAYFGVGEFSAVGELAILVTFILGALDSHPPRPHPPSQMAR